MNKRLFYLFTLLFLQFQLPAQNIIRLSSSNGLPHNIVYSITQDKNGLVWFATEDGLCKYDGYTFTTYRSDPGNPNSLPDNLIKCIFTDKEGILWVGTQTAISRFNPSMDGFEQYGANALAKPYNRELSISSICSTDNDRLLISSSNGPIFSFDKRSKRIERIDLNDSRNHKLSLSNTSRIYQDQAGILWIGTYSQGLLRYDTKQKQLQEFTTANGTVPHQYIISIAEDGDHNVWIGTYSGLCVYLQREKRVVKMSQFANLPQEIKQGVIYSLLFDSNKNLWIGTQQDGLYKANAHSLHAGQNDARLIHYTAGDQFNSLPVRTVNSIFEDRDKNIWIGMWSGGACIIPAKPKPFRNFIEHELFANKFGVRKIWGVCEDRLGNIWLGSDGGGLYKWNKSSQKLTHYTHAPAKPNSISDNAILKAFCDSKGEMWFGTYTGGLMHYRRERDDFESFSKTDQSEIRDIRTILEDSHQNLWIGSNGGGLCLFDRKSKTLKQTSFIHFDDFRSIAEYEGLWIGSFQGKLYRMDLNTHKVESWQHEQSKPNSPSGDLFFDILPDSSRHKIWLATRYGGLCEFDLRTKKFKAYKENDGLANNTVLALAMDKKKNIWLSTNGGISKFEPENKRFINFTAEAGVSIGEFSDGSKAYLSDGNICFGGVDGLNVFHPDSIEVNAISPVPTILDFKIFNRSVKNFFTDKSSNASYEAIPREITLKHNENFIAIDFAVINFLNSQSTRYSYLLDGLEKKWNNAGNRRTAYYSNLQPGTYTFKVKSALYENFWSEPIEIKIKIAPPFWKTWWAYSVYFVLCLALSFATLSYYKRKILLEHELELTLENQELQKKVFQDKIVFYNNISHELRTPLTLILSPLEELLASIAPDSNIRQQLKLVYSSAQKLFSFVNRLLVFSKAEEGSMRLNISYNNVSEHIESILHSFSSIARKKGVEVDYVQDNKSLMLWYDKDKLEIILYNLLSNAFKFTPQGGKVQLRLSEQDKKTRIEISDTGKGISNENLKKLFSRFHQIGSMDSISGTGIGLALTQSLVSLHKATIDVQSEEGKGSCFTLCFINKQEIYSKAELEAADKVFSLDVPLQMEESEQDPVLEAKEEGTEQQNLSRHSLLIVEDNPDMQQYLKKSFDNLYKTTTANDGQEALSMIEGGFYPDLIISDVMMPVMDGMSFARELKSRPACSHIPVILLTAKSGINEKLEGLSTGAIDYISKPFNLDILKAKVQNLIAETDIIKEYFKKKNLLEPSVITTISNEEIILAKVKQIIEENLHDPEFNVNNLVDKMAMSHSALYNKIKLYTELSINEFIRHFRIQRAGQLLQTTDFGIADIAYQSGFNDLKYFRECFKKEYGMTPTEFKKKYMNA